MKLCMTELEFGKVIENFWSRHSQNLVGQSGDWTVDLTVSEE